MHLFKRFIDTPFFGPEDGAMAGGADPSDTGADGGSELSTVGAPDGEGDGGDETADADGQGASPAAEDDDEALLFGDGQGEDGDDARPLEERHKRLSQAHNKLKRRFSKSLPLIKLLKEHDLTPGALVDILSKARNFEALEQRVGGDAGRIMRLIEGLHGDDSGAADPRGRATTKRTREDEVEIPAIDEATLPWNRETDSGKYFVKQAHTIRDLQVKNGELQRRLDRLEQGVTGLDAGLKAERETQLRTTWGQAITDAANKIKVPGIRTAFKDLCVAAFKETQGRVPVQKIIAHNLKNLGLAQTTEGRIAAGAAQMRLANGNANRPKHHPVSGAGLPAPARGKREFLSDVSKRIRGIGASA